MGWLFMLFNALAMGLFFGIDPRIGFYLTFALLAVNFATFCLLYDVPLTRARQRVAQQLLQFSSRGIHAEDHQRLQSMKIVATADDRVFRLTFMSGLNLATGIAGCCMLAWALLARFL